MAAVLGDKRQTRSVAVGRPAHGGPQRSLARLAASRGVTQHDVARHAGVTQPVIALSFQREQRGGISAELRAKYERAITSAVAEREAFAKSVAAWLTGEIAAGRLSKRPSNDELRLVASIVRSAAGVNGR